MLKRFAALVPNVGAMFKYLVTPPVFVAATAMIVIAISCLRARCSAEKEKSTQ